MHQQPDRVANCSVLPEVDGAEYASLRKRSTPRSQRYALGRSLRQRVPRSALGEWCPPVGRPDAVHQIMESHQGRVDWLIPVRVGRMIASPYGFLRGTAIVMAEDVAHLPATGIRPVICGDAHLGNFGFYASPERDLVLDLNDFDEAHTGGWEWDLRRLTASIWVAGRQNRATEEQCESAVTSCVAAYRNHIRWLAERPLLARSFDRLDQTRLQVTASDEALRAEIERSAQRARKRVSDRALPRLTRETETGRHIVEEPPLITRLDDAEVGQLSIAMDEYLATLPSHWRRVLGGYTMTDAAHKVVGVGSVGLRAYVVLCEGSSPDDVVFLQLKQARRSVIARFVHGDAAWHAHQGQRVVEYQQALQTVSDPLLGWTTVGGRQFYVRQFRNMKGAIAIDGLTAPALTDYAGICGRLLAKGHARTSGASMIAGYAGSGDNLDRALCRFALRYADQTEQDHQMLCKAVARGLLPAESGF
ncbi:hypothetical protein CQY20_31645 [Mycolicibacterium agri]|nr:DUF2252 domain-containing protein [Mycolicibacterium agri]PEG33288.1 hypothetical protein CQY20_31645 [Mycolicibacterium agri]